MLYIIIIIIYYHVIGRIFLFFLKLKPAEKGGYFTIVRKDPGRFVEECSEDIRRWLKALKQSGKMVFLLTSSHIDYASCLLQVCLG